mgnify:CR=1 FL=1
MALIRWRPTTDLWDPFAGLDELRREVNRAFDTAFAPALDVVEEKDKVFALKLTRRDPGRLEPNAKEVKLFFFSTARDNPAPVILRSEAGNWRIHASSL